MAVPRFATIAVLTGIATGLAALHRLGRTYGSTAVERRAVMPGDTLVRDPQIVATHGATLPAPPELVWPWLVQVGWHRGGWYTPRWVDVLFFPAIAPARTGSSMTSKNSKPGTSCPTEHLRRSAGSLFGKP